jgi:indolepyruvate ferredoxin oxidoreductase beta subunit
MKNDIILAGVGGQGILTIAASIGYAALAEELVIKQAEVHGMSQRGGAVQSHMRLSDKEIDSDLIPLGKADLILSVEPMESLRYLPYLSKNGYLVTNSTPYKNIPDYPELEKILKEVRKLPKQIIVDADKIARDLGSPKSSNIVMLGAASPFIELHPESFEKGIEQIFRKKGDEVVKVNIKAFYSGRTIAEEINMN